MKKLILLLFIGIFISCNKDSETTKLELLFAPSFSHPTKFTIDVKKKTIEQFTFQDSYYKEDETDSDTGYIVDTLIVHYQKTFKIDENNFNTFIGGLKSSKLDSTVEHRRDVFDGIGFRISKISSKNDTISLTSISPERTKEFQMEYQILDAFFDLAYKTVNDYEGISTIENIQEYFYYGLPIKKIQNNPIEYRIWGSISGCRKDNPEFIKLLEGLPKDKPVIFDLRNGSIAYCLNEVLEEFSEQKDIYIYGDKSMLDSKEIMDEIKLAEENGEELSDLSISTYETHKMIYEDWKNNTKIKSFLTREEIIKTINLHQ